MYDILGGFCEIVKFHLADTASLLLLAVKFSTGCFHKLFPRRVPSGV